MFSRGLKLVIITRGFVVVAILRANSSLLYVPSILADSLITWLLVSYSYHLSKNNSQ